MLAVEVRRAGDAASSTHGGDRHTIQSPGSPDPWRCSTAPRWRMRRLYSDGFGVAPSAVRAHCHRVSFKDHFSSQSSIYAKSRPRYPVALFAELAALAPARTLAWDCGTGNGQAAIGLAELFEQVVATEPSAAQLAEATPHPRVRYEQSAERFEGIADASVDLVTVAQAAHWFDRPMFYEEVRRVLRPGGVVALWTYALCSITPPIDAAIFEFYQGAIGPFWPPERRHCETGYRELDFPFVELPFPSLAMEHAWTLGEMATYLRSWSAVTRYATTIGVDPVLELEEELAPLWGDGRRKIVWPLAGRIGRIGGSAGA
jgi:SAM-dependent methyltransferase